MMVPLPESSLPEAAAAVVAAASVAWFWGPPLGEATAARCVVAGAGVAPASLFALLFRAGATLPRKLHELW